ncbi:MAG: riboflavin synthase [Saprospiraceae bacterium]|jgi:riboflavin synthase
MFTGIIEALGTVRKIEQDRSNITFTIESPIASELKIDQSVSHDGVCLTVVACTPHSHAVTAVAETLQRSKLGDWKEGTQINLERCMALGDRLDGHIVQGHVDTVARCTEVLEQGGSWKYTFKFDTMPDQVLVDKGSVCVNGVSLTVVAPGADYFSVAIIPYTWEFTNFKNLRAGEQVNIEFDIIGKYVAALAQRRLQIHG